MTFLKGKKGLVVGIANDQSIAWGCAKAFHEAGAEQAITWLNQNYQMPLRIEDLAREVNLSISTLHHRFKAVTSMSPLQYQKQLRLQEARRLMLNDGLEAAVAAYRVGYESPSQFSREYSRLYGAPPIRDVARLRATAG